MGIIIALFQSPGTALLFNVKYSNLARYGIMASPSNFKISSEMPSGPTDFFLPIADNPFLIMLILGLPDSLDAILWIITFATELKLHGLSPRANYTDRAAAAGRRS